MSTKDLRFIIEVIRSIATEKIEKITITIVKIGCQKLSSKNHSIALKSWKKFSGSIICSLKMFLKFGRGKSSKFGPNLEFRL